MSFDTVHVDVTKYQECATRITPTASGSPDPGVGRMLRSGRLADELRVSRRDAEEQRIGG